VLEQCFVPTFAKVPYLPILLADRRFLKENLKASASAPNHLLVMKKADFYMSGKYPDGYDALSLPFNNILH
jgi:hypothetical protein